MTMNTEPPGNPLPASVDQSPAGAERRPPPTAAKSSLTPAMRQYLEQKAEVGEAILLFRMGDFYETFWDDAKTISRVLGLTLMSVIWLRLSMKIAHN